MEPGRSYVFDDFRLDPAERRLLRGGEPVALTPKCFDLLVVLIENSGHLIEKEDLLKRLWPGQFVEEGNLSFNVSTLRKALGEGRRGRRYIETVKKKGFRFVARVEEVGGDETRPPVGGDETPAVEDAGAGVGSAADRPEEAGKRFLIRSAYAHRQSTGLKILAGVLAACALVLIGRWLLVRRAGTSAQRPLKTIAVLPFKPLSSESRDESLEMGMAETLITRLGNLRQVVVRPVSAVRKYADPGQDPIKAGRELHADAVLDGSIQKAGDRVRVTVRLMNVESGATLWAEKFDENFTDIFDVQDSISGRVADALALRLSGSEERLLAKRYTDDPEAYQFYLQGEYLWNKRRYVKALSFYQRAAEKDPDFALAYIGIAECYIPLTVSRVPPQEGVSKARDALSKALSLDDTLAQAYNAQAEIKYQFEYDWAGAEKDFQRAVELNPNVAQIRLAYGWCLMTEGRFEEALPQMQAAQELDPHNLRINRAVARLFYFARQYDKALELYRKILEVEPNDQDTIPVLVDVYEQQGRYAEAIEVGLRPKLSDANLKPEEAAEVEALIRTFEESGWQGFVRALLARMEEECKKRNVAPTTFARLHARLGDKDQTFAWLERAVDERDPNAVQLKIDPLYDGLRSDPRYARLLGRMNLTP